MEKVTAQELVVRLNGGEYGSETTTWIEQLAKENGLVIVFGQSDDLVEFRGAIEEEFGCYAENTFYVINGKVFDEGSLDEVKNALEPIGLSLPSIPSIHAEFCPSGSLFAWVIQAEDGCQFNIYEDGEEYCQGIVVPLHSINSKLVITDN